MTSDLLSSDNFNHRTIGVGYALTSHFNFTSFKSEFVTFCGSSPTNLGLTAKCKRHQITCKFKNKLQELSSAQMLTVDQQGDLLSIFSVSIGDQAFVIAQFFDRNLL